MVGEVLVPFILIVVVFNLVSFLVYLKDMKIRGEKRLLWFFLFLLLGPLAIAWYKSSRKLLKDDDVSGGKLHNFARCFILPWTIYILVLPALYIGLLAGYELIIAGVEMPRRQYLNELIVWGMLLYVFVFIAWLIPTLLAGITALVSKPKVEEEHETVKF